MLVFHAAWVVMAGKNLDAVLQQRERQRDGAGKQHGGLQNKHGKYSALCKAHLLHVGVDELVEGVQLLPHQALLLKEGVDDCPGILLQEATATRSAAAPVSPGWVS